MDNLSREERTMAVKTSRKTSGRVQGRGKSSRHTRVPGAASLKSRILQTISEAGEPITAAELRKRLQLKQAVFARMVPLSQRSLATLESGTPPTEVVARRLVELQRLTDALSEVMREETLGTWLQTPNDAFNGLKPVEVIDRGESDRLWEMIYSLRSGVPS